MQLSESILDHPQRWAGAVFLLSLSILAIPAYQWLHAERENVGAVPRAIDKQGAETREWLRANALPIIQGAVDKANERTKQGLDAVQGATAQVVGPDGQVAALRGDVMEMAGMLSAQLTAGLAVADKRLGEVTATADGIAEEAKPVLANAAKITEHANESAAILFRRDALPAQLLGTLGATKVTMGEVAQTMKTVRDATPKVADSVIGIGKSADGITADIHTATSDFVKPKTFWQKFKSWLETSGKIAARFI